MTPQDRKYTKEHEWIKVEGNIAKIGITDHAQESMGDIVFVELPAVGDTVEAGDSVAVVESVKAVSDIYTSVAGTVVEVNQSLDEQPEGINADPYGSYLAAIEFTVLDESQLLDAAAYDAFVAAEG